MSKAKEHLKAFLRLACPIHPEAWPFLTIFATLTAIFFIIEWPILGSILTALTIWCAYFFRNPERHSISDSHFLISPADGRVCEIKEVNLPIFLQESSTDKDKKVLLISIFMNVVDCHINRLPFSGKVTKRYYQKGLFLNAADPKASLQNELMAYSITTENPAHSYSFCQVAGLIARRIVPFVHEGDTLQKNDRIGLIRFGSRVDLYLPLSFHPLVTLGMKLRAGESLLADIRGPHAG